MNACSNKPKVLRWLPENNPSQKTEDGGSKPVGTEQLNAFLQLFTHGWWRGGPYRPADVNTLIIINKHKALKIMDQSDGYASLMLEKKNNQEEENKGNTQPTGAPGNDALTVLHKVLQWEI